MLLTICVKEAKINIAKKIVPLIQDEMVILIGGGDIAIELVKQLPETLVATFFTISPLVAVELTKFQNLEVVLIGGLFSKDAKITFGGHVINQITEIKADLCIVEANGLHPKNGLTDSELAISQLKKAMLNAAQRSAILCYAERLNTSLKTRVAKLNEIDYLVTELDKSDKKLKAYQAAFLQKGQLTPVFI
ncbi:DeoR/GlpR family DNA-binding transcription regulator [Pedobacter insulae]|uniref:DeoR C terminal sensor domain-containing protein n=1 Tax=Pedobacter insulae TaxID=414048 RepID=A0A1I2Z8X9_9SPHI|nr:hypothetical protein [Pedobacter insulae]SFH34140.1 DeoR C terminal sensor domain-containing protein [Pedobacter insulae]